MAKINQLTELSEWQALWEELKAPGAASVLIFKRSPICPTSFMAEAHFQRWASARPEGSLKIYSVDVIAARPISQRIAADTKVTHQSPQALLLNAGRVVAWHASHGDIEVESLETNVSHS